MLISRWVSLLGRYSTVGLELITTKLLFIFPIFALKSIESSNMLDKLELKLTEF